jgi:hypothetical protein
MRITSGDTSSPTPTPCASSKRRLPNRQPKALPALGDRMECRGRISIWPFLSHNSASEAQAVTADPTSRAATHSSRPSASRRKTGLGSGA